MTTHTIETISPCEQRISVTVSAKTVQKATQAKARQKSARLNYGGFRPNTRIAQQLAAKKITPQEVAEIQQQLCKDTFSSLCDQENIHYEGTPILSALKYNPDGSLSYLALIEVYPHITHVNWEAVSLLKLDTKIDDEAFSMALPLVNRMGLGNILATKETGMHWCQWMVEVFQHQQLRDQVMQALSKQNTVHHLPPRIIEARYQELKRDQKEAPIDEAKLRQQAEQYITADILFKAYAVEHKISLSAEMLSKRIETAKHNPFIMSQLRDPSLLPYYLGPRVFEEMVIHHLVDHADCKVKWLPLHDLMALAFNTPKEAKSEQSTSQERVSSTATEEISHKESTQ